MSPVCFPAAPADTSLRPGAGPGAGLVHSTDAAPGGWRRVRVDPGDAAHFEYRDADGQPIEGDAELARIRGLAVPPACR